MSDQQYIAGQRAFVDIDGVQVQCTLVFDSENVAWHDDSGKCYVRILREDIPESLYARFRVGQFQELHSVDCRVEIGSVTLEGGVAE